MLERLFALILLFLFFPLLAILYLLVKLTSKGPFLFRQKRMGKNKKIFVIYKIRTMAEGAENLKAKIQNLNQSDGPTFKIYDDPRYTKIGKLLSHTAVDEIPQLINILKGEMAFVGPRPLPVDEAKKIPKEYLRRFSVLPGMTSLWVVRGTNHASFKSWMEDDLEYVGKKSWQYDMQILWKTGQMVLKMVQSH